MIHGGSSEPGTGSHRLIAQIRHLKAQSQELQRQLASQTRSQTFADAPNRNRLLDLGIAASRTRSFLDGAKQASQSTAHLLDVFARARASLVQTRETLRGVPSQPATLAELSDSATAQLQIFHEAMQSDLAGSYFFGGTATDHRPLADLQELLAPTDGRIGFVDLVEARYRMDAADLGHLTLSKEDDQSVRIAEDGAEGFGLKLVSATRNGQAWGSVEGPIPAIEMVFARDHLQAGDVFDFTFSLPDGTTASVKLNAGGSGDGSPFVVVEGDQARNLDTFVAALTEAIGQVIAGEMRAASSAVAAENFFFDREQGQPLMPKRLPDGSFQLGLLDQHEAVYWYRGQSAGEEVRDARQVSVGSGDPITFGTSAQESGFLAAIRAMAMLASAERDDDNQDYRAGIAQRADAMLAEQALPGIEAVEYHVAAMGQRAEQAAIRLDEAAVFIEGLRADANAVDPIEVSLRVNELLSRMQALYASIARLEELSLVHFL